MNVAAPWNRLRRGIGFFFCKWKMVLLAAGLCGTAAAQQAGQEISGFRVPEYDEHGEMTTQLFGDHAEFESGGVVKITTLRVEFYRDGEVFMEVASPWCIYNQKEQTARSDAPLRADMDGTHLTGMGFEMDSASRTVHVLSESKVVVEDVMDQSGGLPSGGERGSNDVTVITSEELFLNYQNKSALFSGTVHVEDPELQLNSESLELRFGENNEIDWIEALTDVTILHQGREAYAGKAVYEALTGEFLLEENPRLVEGKNMLMGDRIRFWRDTGKMICEPSARLVIYSGEKSKLDFFEK